MGYTDEDIRQAYLQDEAARLAQLAVDDHLPRRNLYGDVALTDDSADGVASLSFEDIDAAVAELAARRGEDYTDTWDQVHTLTSGENDVDSLANAVVALAQMPEGETVAELTGISAAERQMLVKAGHALPDGSYAIRHKADLHAMATLAASGYGNVLAARRHIKKRAAELGVDHRGLPGFGSDGDGGGGGPSGGGGGAAMTARQRRSGLTEANLVQLAAGEADEDDDEGTVSRIVAAHPELFKPTRHPVGKVTTKTRAHSTVEDPSDRQHPRDGGVVHPEVQRYLDMAEERSGGKERPSGSVVSYPPRAYRPPGPAGKPQNRA